jgi:hypothetical protein
MEILDTEQESAPMPSVVIRPGMQYYRGIFTYKENLVPILNEDGLLKCKGFAGPAGSPANSTMVDPQYVKNIVFNKCKEVMILDFERLFHAR